MSIKKAPVVASFFSAFLATLCCLPAFLFIFFGISSTWFAYMTSLEFLRIPMSLVSLGFFIFGILSLRKKQSCTLDKKQKVRSIILLSILFLSLAFLLFYPEIIPFFME